MEVALNSVVASSTHKYTLLDGRYPTLLESNNSICNKKINIANNGVSQSILNFFGSPQKCRYNGGLTSNDAYTLESLMLKNALNMNNNNDDVIDVHQLIENQKSQYKLLQCNNTDLQPKTLLTTTTDLLAALKITNTTNKIIKNRHNSSNASNFSTSPPSTPLSTSLTVDTLSTTNSSISSTLKAVSTGTPPSNNSVVNKVTKNGLQIPSDILDDLASRFIINNPDMELSNFIRICFQIELAHWFYLDFFCAAVGDQPHHEELRKRKLPTCGMKQFAIQIFQHIPFLREHVSSIDQILDDWKNYKLAVPTFGAILISEDLNYCLLVQSYFAKCSWGFPKGKVNENEDPVHCATREVYEETGYDITKLIVPNDYIEAVINYQYTRLYIVRDVSLDTQFSPRTRNEIKCCDWFPIDSLPINKNDAISKAKLGINANSFFMIIPFVKRLKKWVNDKRAGIETRRKFSGGGRSTSPESMNSPTSQLTTLTAAAGTTVGGSNQNSYNQKQTNVNNSSKKNKQHTNNNNDDKHKASNNNGGNNHGVNATPTSTNKNNSNRSKRQRHKSMGDLDCNSNNNFKNSTHATAVSDDVESSTELTVKVGDSGNCRTVSNHKRNGNPAKHLAPGSNNNNGAGCTSSKRQLFHSQSQNGNNQSGEKIVSSFDLIRKEKQQQMKAAAQAEKAAKAQKQQQQQQQQQSQGNANCNNSGRVRAKSQGDKMCVQQQQQHQQNTNKNNNTNNNNGGNNKHRVQKQLSMIIVNSNATANNDNNKSNHNNNNATHNTATQSTRVATTSQTTPTATCSGVELLAFAAKSAAAPSMTAATHSAQKPRPASVNLHFATSPTPVTGQATQQLQRMASGTNLRILNRSTSHQPQTEQQNSQTKAKQSQQFDNNQVQRQQQAQLKFTPSFNSWTNFSFTKNFIANVFC